MFFSWFDSEEPEEPQEVETKEVRVSRQKSETAPFRVRRNRSELWQRNEIHAMMMIVMIHLKTDP